MKSLFRILRKFVAPQTKRVYRAPRYIDWDLPESLSDGK